MKNYIIALLAVTSLTACGQKPLPTYTINGTAEGAEGLTAYLVSGRDTLGSSVVTDGKFSISGTLDGEKTSGFVAINHQLSCSVFLEEGEIAMNLNNHTATGTNLNDANAAFSKIATKLVEEYRLPNSNQDSIVALYDQLYRETSANHVGDAFGLALVQSMAEDMTIAEIDSVMALCPLYANDSQLQETRKVKETEEKTSAGQQYIDIEGINALSEEPIKLSDILAEGKPVVVDFWASWCGPCRREISDYLSKYSKQYKGKVNFVGIAVWEKGIADTKTAISELPITWPVIYTGEEASRNVTDSYGIQGIPQIMVIDPDGKIRGRNLRGEAIAMMLDVVLNK